MQKSSECWDYLVVTASNRRQAGAYQIQLDLRSRAGQLNWARHILALPDIDDRRIGSGASTLNCLSHIVNLERRGGGNTRESVRDILARLRVLIVHAGGDSKRLPAYAPAGKSFVPLPGTGQNGIPLTLFDRLVPAFSKLNGQIVITSGDALVQFASSELDLNAHGIVLVGCRATAQEASRHGVLCPGDQDSLRLYLQKPDVAAQAAAGAMDHRGHSILDIGVMSLDPEAAAALIEIFAPFRAELLAKGLDLYREISCALGTEGTLEHYIRSSRASGSQWDNALLARLFQKLNRIPVTVRIVPSCRFLHFGSTRQLIESGRVLANGEGRLSINNSITPGARIQGESAWVEACRIRAPLKLAGRNVVIGVDVTEPLSLAPDACLEVLAGRSRDGRPVWFIRCYGIDDTFKDPLYFGRPFPDWLRSIAAETLWDSPVFPAESEAANFKNWLWLFDLDRATPQQQRALIDADRYSAAEIALLADQAAFHQRRTDIMGTNKD